MVDSVLPEEVRSIVLVFLASLVLPVQTVSVLATPGPWPLHS